MRVLFFLLALGAAAFVHALGLWTMPVATRMVDPFLLAVLWSARGAPTAAPALLAGTAGGLVRDALTGGRLGLHGFAYTLVAWLLQGLRQRFVIQTPLQVTLLFTLVAAVEQTVLALLEVLLAARPELPRPFDVIGIVVTTGVLAGIFHVAGEHLGVWAHERGERRRRRLGLETRG